MAPKTIQNHQRTPQHKPTWVNIEPTQTIKEHQTHQKPRTIVETVFPPKRPVYLPVACAAHEPGRLGNGDLLAFWGPMWRSSWFLTNVFVGFCLVFLGMWNGWKERSYASWRKFRFAALCQSRRSFTLLKAICSSQHLTIVKCSWSSSQNPSFEFGRMGRKNDISQDISKPKGQFGRMNRKDRTYR